MSDLIERRVAIEEIYRLLKEVPIIEIGTSTFHDGIIDGYARAISSLRSIPSSQPEIIRCKDCKWFNKLECAIWIKDDSDKPTENDYCSFAEKRGEQDD